MKIEIPAFLLEMSKEINTQDNCMTSEPIITVCHDERLTTAEGYQEDGSKWCDEDGVICDGEDSEALIEHLSEYYPEWLETFTQSHGVEMDDHEEIVSCFDADFDDLPDDISRWFYQNTRKTVKYCLTRSDAETFIERQQHNYPKLYTYVESMHSCPQMIELRNWIMSLEGKSK